MHKTLIFDTETTGLIFNRTIKDDKLPRIIEIYGCLVDLNNQTILDEFETLVNPGIPIPKEITRITGLEDEHVKEAPTFKLLASWLQAFMESADEMIAHNLAYDEEVMRVEFDRLGLKVKMPPMLCTVEQTVHLKGYRLSLSKLHEHLFGEAFADAHEAKADVLALVRCCFELRKRGVI